MIDFKYEGAPAGFRRFLIVTPCDDGTQSTAAVDVPLNLTDKVEVWKNTGSALAEALFMQVQQHETDKGAPCSKS